ncbi:MAG TPA: di-heme oxidoredictase family protein, partial [Candidatus Angelobacter sp.]|nr:di-heme oxidoredictase family protein [Candidatus Angelobacter sp.]
VGCATCHNSTLGNTQPSNVTPGLGGAAVNAFTDLEFHHMGTVLNDNVGQGNAGGDQFRTAPLWGLGQRVFFLHDGRCSDLLCAIEAHDSSGGEATTVETNFDNLTTSQQQDVLNFLRSL